MSLSRQDVVLGRALLAWKLVQRPDLLACADDVRRLSAQGRPATLGQVLIQRGFLSIDRYQAIVARLHQVYMESSSASAEVQRATEQVPFMSESGRYTTSFQRPNAMAESTVERAVQGWQQAADQVTASGHQIEYEFDDPPPPPTAASPPAHGPGAAGAPPSTGDVARIVGPDGAIRRKLKVPPGQTRFPIGGWIVEQYLDAGNWGIVYRVSRQGGDATPFALKVLKHLEPTEEVRKRFIQEARTMAKLSHPGICHVHDAGVAEGLLWFVMDFLEGASLSQVLEERGTLGVADGLRLVRKLCSAVAYAHSRSVLHRDLKPDNVVMAPDGRPVLTDFGLAKDVESGFNLTQEGQRIGTPLYMAPELLLDSGKANPASEVYSLGAILFQCLTGRPPFQAKAIFELVDQIEAGKLPPLRKLCPDASRALEKLLRRTLHKDAAKRPQSAAELATELVRCG